MWGKISIRVVRSPSLVNIGAVNLKMLSSTLFVCELLLKWHIFSFISFINNLGEHEKVAKSAS